MLYLLKYLFVSENIVRIYLSNGSSRTIQLNNVSGRVIWRYKMDSLTRIKHPGIYLGMCLETNEEYVIHNHIDIGHTFIDTLQGFSKGRKVFAAEKCINEPVYVVRKALQSVMKREKYTPLNYNCQTFANEACYNQRRSEDADKWKAIGTGLLFASSFFLLLRRA